MSTPLTHVRTSHAITIKASGVTVGLINTWSNTQSKTMTPIYELDIDNSGNPIEYMPGNVTGLTITVTRYDTYPKRMEEAFGTPDLVMLTRQSQPFSIVESWYMPNKSSLLATRDSIVSGQSFEVSPKYTEERYLYTGCWFTSLGRTLRADDNRVVNVNATLVYTSKQRVSGFLESLPLQPITSDLRI